jgi:hypothetical protein
LIAVLYVGYTTFDGPPLDIHLPAVPAALVTSVPVPAPVVIPRLIIKCIVDGATTYSDEACAPGALVDVIGTLPPSK